LTPAPDAICKDAAVCRRSWTRSAGVQYHHDPVIDDRVRLDPLDPKTARHAGQCEFNGVTDPAMLRAVLRVTRKDGYDWVECNACAWAWQVAHFAESVG
jgi:hypothetical protein